MGPGHSFGRRREAANKRYVCGPGEKGFNTNRNRCNDGHSFRIGAASTSANRRLNYPDTRKMGKCCIFVVCESFKRKISGSVSDIVFELSIDLGHCNS